MTDLKDVSTDTSLIIKCVPLWNSLFEPLCFLHLPVSSRVEVTQSYLTLCNPIDRIACQASVYRILKAKILEWSHSLLQGIFPTQGSNPGLLYCWWICYHLSHQGASPMYWCSDMVLGVGTAVHGRRFLWYISQQTWTSSSLGTLWTSWSLLVHPGVYPGVSTYGLIVQPQSSLHLPSRDRWVICYLPESTCWTTRGWVCAVCVLLTGLLLMGLHSRAAECLSKVHRRQMLLLVSGT